MSETQTSNPNPVQNESHLKNLANLHRMSRTAGLGTTDYAAVNVPAVITCVIGLASVLAIAIPVFLFIPVIGLIVGIIAIKQLRASNGTQTGLTLAIIGLLGCLAFSGMTGYKLVKATTDLAESNKEKTALIDAFGKAIMSGEYDKAYSMFDARLAERVTKERVRDLFEKYMIPRYGKTVTFKSNEAYVEETATDDPSIRMAACKIIYAGETMKKGEEMRLDVGFRYSAGEWKISNMPQLFPPEKSTQQKPG